MKKTAYIFLLFVFSAIAFCSPIACQSNYKNSSKITIFLNKIKDALAQSVKNSPIFSSLALYTLCFQRNLIKDHPYIAAFIGTDLISNFLYNYYKPDIQTNALAQTISSYPISSALILYALIANPDLARNHPLISIFLVGSVAYAWAQNAHQEAIHDESHDLNGAPYTLVSLSDGQSLTIEANSSRNGSIVVAPTF